MNTWTSVETKRLMNGGAERHTKTRGVQQEGKHDRSCGCVDRGIFISVGSGLGVRFNGLIPDRSK